MIASILALGDNREAVESDTDSKDDSKLRSGPVYVGGSMMDVG
jgi:hypothetical protein